MIELMKPKMTFAQSEIQDGDVICFQVEISEKETHDLESQGLHANPLHYYDFLQNRVMIDFRPKFDEIDDHNPEFEIIISKKMNYDHVCLHRSELAENVTHFWYPIDGCKGGRTSQPGPY